MRSFYPLLTARVSIEPLAMQDLEPFVRYRQDPAVARFQSWETNYSLEQATDLIGSQTGVLLPVSGDWLQLAIHELDNGELLGDLALHALENAAGAFEIGFTLASENQGRGYAREAVRRLLEFLFDEIAAEQVSASCDQRNQSSIRLLSSLGFELQPAKGWSEEFKGEHVNVLYFELSKQSFQSAR